MGKIVVPGLVPGISRRIGSATDEEESHDAVLVPEDMAAGGPMITLVKILFSALLLGGVNMVAQRNPAMAGWIAGAPLVSLLSVFLLVTDGKPNAEIGQFLGGVLVGVVPTIAFLAAASLLLKRDVALGWSIAAGLGLFALVTLGMKQLGWLDA
jgi:hypothetical protein